MALRRRGRTRGPTLNDSFAITVTNIFFIALASVALLIITRTDERLSRISSLVLLFAILGFMFSLHGSSKESQSDRLLPLLALILMVLPRVLGLRLDWQKLGEGLSASKWRRPSAGRTLWANEGGHPGREKNASLSDYEILESIGVGGMADVHLATRRSDGQTVALKIPHERHSSDEKFLNRFYREAAMLASIRHENVVAYLGHNAEKNRVFLAMEYVPGKTLEDVFAERTFDFSEIVQILCALAKGLKNIHIHKITHRDIKPANIMLKHNAFDEEGRLLPGGVKIMDFGIAISEERSRMTMSGARVGTPSYMAPEQAQGSRGDETSDIYSLGLVGYELITGKPAFSGDYQSVVEQQQKVDAKPPNQLRAGVPSRLNDLIMAMTRKHSLARPTLDEIIGLLEDPGILKEDDFSEEDVMIVGTDDLRGTLRVLDQEGKIRMFWGHTSTDGGEGLRLPGAPLAMCDGGNGELYLTFSRTQIRSAPGSNLGPLAGTGLVWVLGSDGQFLRSFGPVSTMEEGLLSPVGIVVLDDTVFILDNEKLQVKIFTRDGHHIKSFGRRGTDSGEFEEPRAIATDGTHIYVFDYYNRRVQMYTPGGQYQRRYAFKISNANDDLRVLSGFTVNENIAYFVDNSRERIFRVRPKTNENLGSLEGLRRIDGESNEWVMGIGLKNRLFAAPRGSNSLRIIEQQHAIVTQNMHGSISAICSFRRVGLRPPPASETAPPTAEP